MKVPNWLGDIGKKHWKQLVPFLKDDRQASMLALLCQAYDDYHTAREHIKEHGQSQKQGERWYVNPNVTTTVKAQALILRYLRELKLPPFDGGEPDKPSGDWAKVFGDEDDG